MREKNKKGRGTGAVLIAALVLAVALFGAAKAPRTFPETRAVAVAAAQI